MRSRAPLLAVVLVALMFVVRPGHCSGCPFSSHRRRALQETWGQQRLFTLESNWSESQDWRTKLDRIWNEIQASPRVSNHYPSLLEYLFRLFLLGDDYTRLRLPLTFRPSMNTVKTLHSSGAFGRIRLRWTDADFRSAHTGLFSEPEIEGIMSGSGGNPFVGNQSVAYGWGLKFFRTNAPPANILTLNAFFGGGAYWNVLGYMTCNHASIAEMSALGPTLAGWSRFPNQNGLKTMAAFTINGTEVRVPKFPYALCFVPNMVLRDRIGSPTVSSPMSAIPPQMGLIRIGERILDVVAILHPRVLEHPSLLRDRRFVRRVGDVWVTGTFQRSQFADSRLFFQHQPFDDDLLVRPDWIPYMNLRNLLREGSFGVYSPLFPPPRPEFREQLETLGTLVGVFTRLFTDPVHQEPAVMELLGVDSFRGLLRAYIRQGGPPGLRWRLSGRLPPYATGPQPPPYAVMATGQRKAAESSGTSWDIHPLAWSPSVPTTFRQQDPFMVTRLRYLNLSHALRRQYITNGGDDPEAIEGDDSPIASIRHDLWGAALNLPTFSPANAGLMPAAILLGKIRGMLQPLARPIRRRLSSWTNRVVATHILREENDHHELMPSSSHLASYLVLCVLEARRQMPRFPESSNDIPVDPRFTVVQLADALRSVDPKLIMMYFVEPTYWAISGPPTPESHQLFETLVGSLMGFVPYAQRHSPNQQESRNT